QRTATAAADEIQAQGQPPVHGKFVTLPIANDQIQRFAASGFGIAILVEAQVIDAYGRAEGEAPRPPFVCRPAREGQQRPLPGPANVLRERLAVVDAGKGSAATEGDQ